MSLTSRLSALLPQHASNFALPQLNYPIDRPYRWKWLPYAAYGFMLLVLVILVPTTYASQGYEIVTAYKQDPNTTSVHWYHTFTGKPRPGSQCNEHVFNMGDTFVTSIGVFSYTIQTILYRSSDGLNVFGGSTIPYKGISTDFCDIVNVNLQVGIDASVVGKAYVQCVHEDFQIVATTSVDSRDINFDLLHGSSSSPMFIATAADDLKQQPVFGYSGQTISGAYPAITSSESSFSFCPMAIIKNETNFFGKTFIDIMKLNGSTISTCRPQDYDNPPIDPENVYMFGTGFDIDSTNNTFLRHAIVNYMQVLASVVRYDLGSQLPSNFLLNPSAVLSQNKTFLPLDPVGPRAAKLGTSETIWTMQLMMKYGSLPMGPIFNASAPNQPAPPTLLTTYACRLTVPKPAGAAIVSVIVATLSIGGSIWGLLMLTAAFFAKRNRPEANCCEYHSLEAGLPKSLNASEERLELQDNAVDELEMTARGIGDGASTPTHVAYRDASTPET